MCKLTFMGTLPICSLSFNGSPTSTVRTISIEEYVPAERRVEYKMGHAIVVSVNEVQEVDSPSANDKEE